MKISADNARGQIALLNECVSNTLRYSAILMSLSITGHVSADPRIINGELAKPGEFSNVAALFYNAPDLKTNERFFCGGSLIGKRWILSAAHCLFTPDGQLVEASNISVHFDSPSFDDPSANIISVSARYLHPNYQVSPIPFNDIALIQLSQTTSVEPMRVADSDPNTLAGNPGQVVGWGSIGQDEDGLEVYTVDQRKLTIPIVSRSVCNDIAGYGGLISREHVCAGRVQGGIDSCYGDSGGPLMYDDKEDGLRQIGIVSFGRECAIPYSYGVYTSVDIYSDWIDSVTSVYGSAQVPDSAVPFNGAQGGLLSLYILIMLCCHNVIKRLHITFERSRSNSS